MQITRLLKAPYTEFSFFIISAVTAAEAMDLQLHMYVQMMMMLLMSDCWWIIIGGVELNK